MATIKVTKSELKECITEAIKCIIAESKLDYAISFETLVNLLQELGWGLYNEFESSLRTGEKGMTYEIMPDRKGCVSSREVGKAIIKNAEYPNGIRFYQNSYGSRCSIFAMSVKANKDNPNILPTVIKDINDGEYDELIQNGLKNGMSLDDIASEICKNTPDVQQENYYLISRIKKIIQRKIGEQDKNQLDLNLM